MYALREAFSALRRAPVLAGLSAMMIALSLFVVGLFGLVAYNVREVIAAVEARVEVVAYLLDTADAGAVEIAQQQIAQYPEVKHVRYVSREEALAVARRDLGELSEMFNTLDSNPLPASLEVSLQPGQEGPAAVRAVADRISQYPFVEEVQFGEDWLDKIFVLRRVAALATFMLGFGFTAIASLIIGAAIRMAVFARRDEIVIMRLVGATDGFVRRPFVIEGMLTGLLGAILALGATYGVFRLLDGSVFELVWLPGSWILAGLAVGAFVGLSASAIAVRRHLREIT